MSQTKGRPRWLDVVRRASTAIVVGASVLAPGALAAQSDFPSRPIHFVVGFAPGGPSDIISRVIGARMGDELGHTQVGNNNAYCQDNDTTWLDWHLSDRQQELLRFVQRVIQLRHAQPVFRRRRFFHGKAIEGAGAPDIAWLNVDGSEMTTDTWIQGWVKCLGVVLFGDSIDLDEYGEEVSGDTLLLLFNAAHGHVIPFTLPQLDELQPWELLLDTSEPKVARARLPARQVYALQPFTMALFRLGMPQDLQTV